MKIWISGLSWLWLVSAELYYQLHPNATCYIIKIKITWFKNWQLILISHTFLSACGFPEHIHYFLKSQYILWFCQIIISLIIYSFLISLFHQYWIKLLTNYFVKLYIWVIIFCRLLGCCFFFIFLHIFTVEKVSNSWKLRVVFFCWFHKYILIALLINLPSLKTNSKVCMAKRKMSIC
jgi:hypothetical protein